MIWRTTIYSGFSLFLGQITQFKCSTEVLPAPPPDLSSEFHAFFTHFHQFDLFRPRLFGANGLYKKDFNPLRRRP